jgi:hypothetical protein
LQRLVTGEDMGHEKQRRRPDQLPGEQAQRSLLPGSQRSTSIGWPFAARLAASDAKGQGPGQQATPGSRARSSAACRSASQALPSGAVSTVSLLAFCASPSRQAK